MAGRSKQTMAFKKGDNILKIDAVYPHGALDVDGYDEQGRLLAHPSGGGLQYVFEAGADRQFRSVSPEEQQQALWRSSRFSLEGVDGSFMAWTTGQLWNGWETPHFELDEAQKLIAALNDPTMIRYDLAKDAFVSAGADDEGEFWPSSVAYGIGAEAINRLSSWRRFVALGGGAK